MESNCQPSDAEEILQAAGVILYRRGNGFEFLMLRRRDDCDSPAEVWELPCGPLDSPRQDDVRLVALRNAHLSAGVWPDCYALHRDFVRVNDRLLENGGRVRETFYLAEIDKKTRAGDDIDSETLPMPCVRRFSGHQWMSADLARVRIRTDHGRLLLGQAIDFLESQDQMESMFSVLSSIK